MGFTKKIFGIAKIGPQWSQGLATFYLVNTEFLKVYNFLRAKDPRPTCSLAWVREPPSGIDPHMLAVLRGATCTSHETHNSCRSPQVPQLAASLSVTEPFHRPFLRRFQGSKIPVEV
jgi:hypothetical protein